MEESKNLTAKDIALGKAFEHYKNGNRYVVGGFVKLRTDDGEWVEGVVYRDVTAGKDAETYVRPLDNFCESFKEIEEWESAEDMNPNMESVKIGMTVHSKRMGVGEIYSIDPPGANSKYPVKAKFKRDGGDLGKPTVKTVDYNTLGQTTAFGAPFEYDASFLQKKHV